MTDTSTAGNVSKELQDQVLVAVRKSQEVAVDAIKAWADAVQSIKPPLPTLNPPFADKLPKPEEIVANAYDFAEQLLAVQREFSENVLKAAAPVLTGK